VCVKEDISHSNRDKYHAATHARKQHRIIFETDSLYVAQAGHELTIFLPLPPQY
jgi:hypothetical protein